MPNEAGFEIDGRTYPVPTLDSLNMEEAQVLYDYSGLAVEDFVSPHPDMDDGDKEAHQADMAQNMKNPGILRALMHITYQRGNTTVRPGKVKALVGSANVFDAILAFAGGDQEDDALPPASTTEPEQSSPNGSVGSNTSSGEGSSTGSVAPAETPVSTGVSRSVMPLTVDRKLSAV